MRHRKNILRHCNTLRHRGDIRYTPRDIEEVGNNHIYIKGETSEQATGHRSILQTVVVILYHP